MKKFLKKYGYILLVVVIAAGCYTGFRAFRYYYHDTDDYCLRTYGTMARVYKNAVFDTNRKSLLRHISAEKGLK